MGSSEDPATEAEWLSRAQGGDADAFDPLIAPHRARIHAHCYRMLGSPFDADDALQETWLAAWRGLASFESRSALSTWLVRIATHVCLRMIAQRPWRRTSPDHAAQLATTAELGDVVDGPVWLEPFPDSEAAWLHDDPATTVQHREQVALAFVAALQHLPGTQRAVLLLREVLDYSAAETAEMLDITVASVNSALQRAQKTVRERMPSESPAAEWQRLGELGQRELLRRFVQAWESRDLAAMVALLAEDARFTMPPLPSWFDGRAFVAKFFGERVFRTPWVLENLHGNGQPGFACFMKAEGDDRFRPGGVVLLRVRDGRITAIDSFIDPVVCRRFGMPDELPDGIRTQDR